MSDESFKFTPRPDSKYPRLLMRAYVAPEQFVEWEFTPVPGVNLCIHFHVGRESDGEMHIDMFPDTIRPIL